MSDIIDPSATLEGWLRRFSARRGRPIELGLERVTEVARRMGLKLSPDGLQLAAAVIVVGGTNGKGSTCAFIDSIYSEAGYRVACYTSPHLLDFRERLRLNGSLSEAQDWVSAFSFIDSVAQQPPAQDLTYFEFTTLAAIWQINQKPVDIAIFEVGLGGRLDAVNILASDLSVLTSVDLDHQEFLGDTREKIGREKAFIARPRKPFIVADPLPPNSVAEVASQIGADIWQFGRDFNYQGDKLQWSWSGRGQRRNAMAYPALRGANQLLNASATLAAIHALRDRFPVSQAAVRQGFALVSLPGRFQVLPGQPSVVLDVAHNPHAAGVLATNLDQMGFFPRTIAVVGILADKDAEGIFRRLADRIDTWCMASLSGPELGERARLASSLELECRKVFQRREKSDAQSDSVSIMNFDSPQAALIYAKTIAEPGDRIVVFGSFLTVSAAWTVAQSIGQTPHSPHAH